MPKCYFCEKQITKEAVIKYKDKNFHENCVEQYKDKMDLWAYLCKLFSMQTPGPVNYKLAAKYLSDGITYKQMLRAMQYFYEVKNNPVEKAQRRIGIIPYIYQEADEYYNGLEKVSTRARSAQEVQMRERKISFSSMPEKRHFIPPIDIDEVANG